MRRAIRTPKRNRSEIAENKNAAERNEPELIPDRDIGRAANLLIREHGADAEVVSARRADEMLERGDRDGQPVWLRIRRAIVELQAVPVGKTN